MKKRYTVVVLLLTVFLIITADAGVNLKNGNFYISYTDVKFDGNFEVTRTYNSKASETGLFGNGWGSDFESYLVVLPDKSIMIHEHGSGGKTRFKIPNQDNKLYLEGVKKVVEIAVRLGDKEAKTPEDAKKLEESLNSNVEKLMRFWVKYRKKGLVESPEIPVGTTLESKDRGFQTIKRMPDGFLRINSNNKDYFNKKGLLVRIVYSSDYTKNFTYDENENLSTVTDSINRKLTFKFSSKGNGDDAKYVVDSVESQNKEETIKRATYKYDGLNLVETTDVSGNKFKHEYDESFNMTKIGYTDGTSMDIAYHPKTFFVKSMKDRDGSLTTYDYNSNPKEPDNNYSTTVKKFDSDSVLLSENYYEYFIKSAGDGSRYTAKVIMIRDGIKTETEYDKNSDPICIKRNDIIQTCFQYDTSGKLVRKENPREITEIKYYENNSKISRIDTTEKGSGEKTWHAFKYNVAGNLIYGETSDKSSVTLTYNDKGQISSISDESKRVINFKYNERGKPIEISMNEKGKTSMITVKYDEQGELSSVESPEGHTAANRVSQTFYKLLAIVGPAGVNLSL